MRSMDVYAKVAVERAMKVQEVMLRAMAKKITWWRAAGPALAQTGVARAF